MHVYKKDYAWNRGLLFEFWALDARLCKMQVDTKCATPGSLSGWQLATELANDNSAENANCIFIDEPRSKRREYSSFVTDAVSQAQPLATLRNSCKYKDAWLL